MSEPMWTPSGERVASANVTRFMREAGARWGRELGTWDVLYRWSVDEPAEFWTSVWEFAGVLAETRGERVIENPTAMPGARFFPDARLNYAENLMRRRDDGEAIVFRDEAGGRRALTFAELHSEVSRIAQALRAMGVGVGDRVAGYLPNIPETVLAMLAAVSVGAIWSSASPDFGVQGVLDRFGQIEPKVLFCADGYRYNGKEHSSLPKLPAILDGLPTVERVIVVPYLSATPALADLRDAVTLTELVADYEAHDVVFEQLPFDHPLYIMFSSGTTGAPKCIVHGAGGTLLQHLKEHQLHVDVKRDDRVFYYTTCGWMMWNWLVTVLASEATILLFDGSPFYPSGEALFDLADAERMTLFGTAAKFIQAIEKADIEPARSHNLSTLRTMTSTGSVLIPESFDYVYDKVKRDLCLASITGGTDIVSCFILGNPVGPVWRGELQTNGLGMKVEAWDDGGHPLIGEPGELVCTRPFPSMPVGFWNDPGDERYRAAYFERYPGVWHHGDWIEMTEHGGAIVYGRSDATLNPGGVRIGTAEIYRQVERLDEVLDSVVVGQDFEGDVRVVLFVRLRDGLTLDDTLKARIIQQIRANTTHHHVPKVIRQVPDIPRTKSGKVTELAVRDIIHGRPIKNREALANPEALDVFAELDLS